MKVIVVPIAATHHNDLLLALETSIIESIAQAGIQTVAYTNDADFEGATHILVPGVGVWGSRRLEKILHRATQKNIRRILWQMETLPPPDLPRDLATRLLLRPTPHRAKGLSRSLDSALLRRLARTLAATAPNLAETISAQELRLPIREARYIKRLWRAGLLDEVIVCLETRRDFLASMGIPATFMPFGYFGSDAPPPSSQTKDIDVLYIGTRTPRRAKLLSALETGLAGSGYKLEVVEKGLYGDERDRTIARSKLFLHLRNYPWELPRLRLMMAVGGDSLYVTEAFHDTRPFKNGEHFLMAPHDDLLDAILQHLRDDDRRTRIVDQARRFVVGELELGGLLKARFEAGASDGEISSPVP